MNILFGFFSQESIITNRIQGIVRDICFFYDETEGHRVNNCITINILTLLEAARHPLMFKELLVARYLQPLC